MNGEYEDLAACRRSLKGRWFDLQRALQSEIGHVPRKGRWILILAVAAAGFSLTRGKHRPGRELP